MPSVLVRGSVFGIAGRTATSRQARLPRAYAQRQHTVIALSSGVALALRAQETSTNHRHRMRPVRAVLRMSGIPFERGGEGHLGDI
jgi:hypothetical protein